jgi:hypothetical protein
VKGTSSGKRGDELGLALGLAENLTEYIGQVGVPTGGKNFICIRFEPH